MLPMFFLAYIFFFRHSSYSFIRLICISFYISVIKSRVSDPDPDPVGSVFFELKDPDPDPEKKYGSGSGSDLEKNG